MARDYARDHTRSGTRKRQPAASRRQTAAPRTSPWRWYGAGVATGVFLSLLLYLGTLAPASEPGPATAGAVAADEMAAPKPRFDFYTLLPEQTLAVEVEPAEIAHPRASPGRETYLLQAGSFRQREDADRRRAELLLLGLEPRIEASATENGRWFRIYLGPFLSQAEMSKARGLTTAQNIETLLLKRDSP